MSEIKNTQTMNMYNIIESSGNYSQTSGNLWLYYRDQQALDNNVNIIDCAVNDNTSISFKYKKKAIGRTGNDGKKNY